MKPGPRSGRKRAIVDKKLPVSSALLAGCAGGLVGGWAMSEFTRFWKPLAGSDHTVPYSPQEWDAVRGIAELIAKQLTGRELTAQRQLLGAAIVHYFVAGASGAFYALSVARRTTTHSRWTGPLFGVAMWVAGNEFVLPALGLTRKPFDYSVREQTNAFGGHVIYGMATDRFYRAFATHIRSSRTQPRVNFLTPIKR